MNANDYLTEAEQDEIKAVLGRETVISNKALLDMTTELAACNVIIADIVHDSSMSKEDQHAVLKALQISFEKAVALLPREVRDAREKIMEQLKNGNDSRG